MESWYYHDMKIIVCLYAALAAAAIVARQLGWRAAPALKGLPVAFLLLALAGARLAALGDAGAAYYLVIAGLAFGLAGDLLFLDKGRFFKQGIAAFLGGHLLYIAAFAASGMKPVSGPLWPLGAYFGLYAAVLFKSILSKHRAYWGLAAAYLAGVATMTVCAAFADAANAAAGIPTQYFPGAVLFAVSDGILSVRLFKRRFRLADVFVLSTYYAAQGLIAAGAWLTASGS